MDSTNLTTKQYNILNYLYRFRFLTSIQLQKLQNDKTTRLTNYHLKILTAQNYIEKNYSRKLGEGNKPAVYYLAKGSIKLLSQEKNIQKEKLKYIYRENIRSKQFISNSSFIADYYLYLAKKTFDEKNTLYFHTKTDLLPHTYLIHPLPSAYIRIDEHNKSTRRFFLEVIDEDTPRFALRKRVEQYNDYFEGNEFEEKLGHDFPIILFNCPNIKIKKYLSRYIARYAEESSFDQISAYLATKEEAFIGEWSVAKEDEEE